jgi:hypothetical protein
MHKKVNSTVIQVANIIARLFGRYCLEPDQQNRAFEILKSKFHIVDDKYVNYELCLYP